jgi:hypothetical protein
MSTEDLSDDRVRSTELRDARVLVIDANKKELRSLERILKSVVGTVEAREILETPPNDGDFDLVALSYDSLPSGNKTELLSSLCNRSYSVLVLFSGDMWGSEHRELLQNHRLTNFLAKNEGKVGGDDLLVTINKILSRDIFGLGKYFPWGSGAVVLETNRSEEKDEIVARAQLFARNLGVNDRLATSFALVTDELLTNALYNAPVDLQGRHLFSSKDRAEAVTLLPNQLVGIKFCSDGQKIGVSVTDPFGSLTSDVVLNYISKCLRRDDEQIDKKLGGAGLGLFQAFASVSHFILNIKPGHRCEAIGLIDVRGSFKDFVSQAKSFNIFVEEPKQ